MGIHICFLSVIAAVLMLPAPGLMASKAAGTEADSTAVMRSSAVCDAAGRLGKQADSLMKAYRFSEARQIYVHMAGMLSDTSLVLSAADSVLFDRAESGRVSAENGQSMMEYVCSPEVVARHRFSKSDFYLFYPMEDRSWRPVPNQLDGVPGHKYVNATYVPSDASEIYFSATDKEGVRDIYYTHFDDTLWTAPALVDESMTSSGDEIFPVLSEDGKTLYFSSSGLYGAGGYDLYMVRFDEASGTWGIPENLGFPYSSPYDDLLFFNTPDGKYTIFASDRGCPGDSVTVYVLDYESMPVRRRVDDPETMKRIAALEPPAGPSGTDAGSSQQDDVRGSADIGRYRAKMLQVRALRDSVALYGHTLEEKRARLSSSQDPAERNSLTEEIIRREARIPVLQDSLERASATLHGIEMELLAEGVVIDPDKMEDRADKDEAGISMDYVFVKLSPGDPLDIRVAEPEVRFDYSFMILPEGRFAEDNTLPDGIVYQIQMFLLTRPATVAQIKGLSPVFQEKTATGKYIYRVGVFRTYNDVLSNLNKVKRLGFKTAFIVAFHDGKSIPVQKARTLEGEEKASYQVRIVTPGDSLPELAMKAIRQCTDRDIAKIMEDGKTVFVVGPLDSEAAAEKLESMVRVTGLEQVSVVKM